MMCVLMMSFRVKVVFRNATAGTTSPLTKGDAPCRSVIILTIRINSFNSNCQCSDNASWMINLLFNNNTEPLRLQIGLKRVIAKQIV